MEKGAVQRIFAHQRHNLRVINNRSEEASIQFCLAVKHNPKVLCSSLFVLGWPLWAASAFSAALSRPKPLVCFRWNLQCLQVTRRIWWNQHSYVFSKLMFLIFFYDQSKMNVFYFSNHASIQICLHLVNNLLNKLNRCSSAKTNCHHSLTIHLFKKLFVSSVKHKKRLI